MQTWKELMTIPSGGRQKWPTMLMQKEAFTYTCSKESFYYILTMLIQKEAFTYTYSKGSLYYILHFFIQNCMYNELFYYIFKFNHIK